MSVIILWLWMLKQSSELLSTFRIFPIILIFLISSFTVLGMCAICHCHDQCNSKWSSFNLPVDRRSSSFWRMCRVLSTSALCRSENGKQNKMNTIILNVFSEMSICGFSSVHIQLKNLAVWQKIYSQIMKKIKLFFSCQFSVKLVFWKTK